MTADLTEIKESIRAEALRIGFEACGFAEASPVSREAVGYYDNWIAEGKNDCMDYAVRYRDVRNDPRALLDGAKTVISVALNYYPSRFQPADAPRFAYYAYGRDYHEVVRERLNELSRFIASRYDAASRVCVDTAPVREKYWARQAGIGMIGRNNLLIIPGKGSFFFLGELVTTLELPPDAPCEASCGECRLCEVHCPAGALRDGKAADARLCLSCQLIERRGDLPVSAVGSMGNRVYGCDECQLVCPHNRNARSTAEPDFAPSEAFLSLDRQSLLDMTHETFLSVFRHSAVRRVKCEGLQRNARAVKK